VRIFDIEPPHRLSPPAQVPAIRLFDDAWMSMLGAVLREQLTAFGLACGSRKSGTKARKHEKLQK
jgi:hypothetical protein